MRWPFGHLTWPLNPPKKEEQKQKTKQKKQKQNKNQKNKNKQKNKKLNKHNKEGLGPSEVALWKAVFFWKHYKNSVFSKTQLFKNTVSKTHFFTHVKKTPFSKKNVIFGFGQFPVKPRFL